MSPLGMFLQYPDMMVIETFSCNACKKYREEINAIAMLAHLFQERDATTIFAKQILRLQFVFCGFCRNITSTAVK